MTRFATLLTAALAIGAAIPALAGERMSPLVGPETLQSLIDEGEAVVLDIREPKGYATGHVETAVNVPYNAWRGPKDNPGALIADEKVTFLLQEAGIAPEVPVVVTYAGKGTLDFGSAARVYWTLKSAGVEEIAILNGGLAAWSKAGHALSKAEGANIPTDVAFTLSDTWSIDTAGVEAVQEGERDAILIDARPETFFRGKEKHELAAWAGTLAEALSLPHELFFEEASTLKADPEAILAAARAAGWTEGQEVVSFCNTGHWAATNWFALSEVAGIEGVKLYPESMVGWTRANRVASY